MAFLRGPLFGFNAPGLRDPLAAGPADGPARDAVGLQGAVSRVGAGLGNPWPEHRAPAAGIVRRPLQGPSVLRAGDGVRHDQRPRAFWRGLSAPPLPPFRPTGPALPSPPPFRPTGSALPSPPFAIARFGGADDIRPYERTGRPLMAARIQPLLWRPPRQGGFASLMPFWETPRPVLPTMLLPPPPARSAGDAHAPGTGFLPLPPQARSAGAGHPDGTRFLPLPPPAWSAGDGHPDGTRSFLPLAQPAWSARGAAPDVTGFRFGGGRAPPIFLPLPPTRRRALAAAGPLIRPRLPSIPKTPLPTSGGFAPRAVRRDRIGRLGGRWSPAIMPPSPRFASLRNVLRHRRGAAMPAPDAAALSETDLSSDGEGRESDAEADAASDRGSDSEGPVPDDASDAASDNSGDSGTVRDDASDAASDSGASQPDHEPDAENQGATLDGDLRRRETDEQEGAGPASEERGLAWGTLDALSGRALLLQPAAASDLPPAASERFVVRRCGASLALAGSVGGAPPQLVAFAYDIPVLNAAEFDAAAFELAAGHNALAEIDRRRRCCPSSSRPLCGQALQDHLVGLQVRAGRLAVSPTDRRPPPGQRSQIVPLEQLLAGRPAGTPERLMAVVALGGQQIVAGITTRRGYALPAEPIPLSVLQTHLAEHSPSRPLVFLWASEQMKCWLASGRAAQNPSRLSNSLFLANLSS